MEKTSFPPLQHSYLEVGGSNLKPSEQEKIGEEGAKVNCLHEGMNPMLMLASLSHFPKIQLAKIMKLHQLKGGITCPAYSQLRFG